MILYKRTGTVRECFYIFFLLCFGFGVVYVTAINLFHASGLFLYPLKTSEDQRYSKVFRVIEKDQWHEIGS